MPVPRRRFPSQVNDMLKGSHPFFNAVVGLLILMCVPGCERARSSLRRAASGYMNACVMSGDNCDAADRLGQIAGATGTSYVSELFSGGPRTVAASRLRIIWPDVINSALWRLRRRHRHLRLWPVGIPRQPQLAILATVPYRSKPQPWTVEGPKCRNLLLRSELRAERGAVTKSCVFLLRFVEGSVARIDGT